jgi:hypothetical protein
MEAESGMVILLLVYDISRYSSNGVIANFEAVARQ